MRVDHIGIACRNIEKAIGDYSKLGFTKVHDTVIEGKTQRIRAQFMRLGNFDIELLESLKDGEKSIIESYIQSPRYCMYHICYESDDFETDLEKLTSDYGFRKLGEVFTDSSHEGRKLCFLFHVRLGVVEIAECIDYTEEKWKKI